MVLMEIAQEHTARIQEIISGMECPKDFVCYESGLENLCKVKVFRDGELVECLDKSSWSCKFSFRFGRGCFCKCTLRRYIAKNLNR